MDNNYNNNYNNSYNNNYSNPYPDTNREYGYNPNFDYGYDYNNNYNYNPNPNPNPVNTYQMPPQNLPNTKGNVSLVLGILAMTLCCCIGSILGLIGTILAIVALTKKNHAKGTAIAGLITSILGIIIGVIAAIYIASFILVFSISDGLLDDIENNRDSNSTNATVEQKEPLPLYDEIYEFDDSSDIYFNADYTFYWYKDDSIQYDNYYSGTYSVYTGEEASEYLYNDLEEYGITESEMEDYYERNSDSDFYRESNLVVLVLYTDYQLVDGEPSDVSHYTYYYGFYDDGVFDAVNLDTASTTVLERK